MTGDDGFGFAGEDVDWRDPAVQAICDALCEIGPDLRALGHAHARLDANARMLIARHLVGRGVRWEAS